MNAEELAAEFIYQLEIDDDIIMGHIENIINTALEYELKRKYSGVGDVITQAVKELVYSRKDEIIDMVVDRATREIVRKGLPKLIALREDANGGADS